RQDGAVPHQWTPATPDRAMPRAQAADTAEAMLARRLLGDLPAFPHADMADILDVRARLTDARTRFRAAMAAAGRELVDVPAQDWTSAVAAFRREHVDEALLNIREELEELRAAPTLLRALREKWAVPAVMSVVVATTMLDPTAVAASAATSAGVA